MYSIAIIKYSINLYFKLKKDNIIDKKKIKYIELTFDIRIIRLVNIIFLIIIHWIFPLTKLIINIII